ncbi:MAG: hypothetical protein GF310_12660 [candidate division Zixibacteria bacterium]|nr:hypothetical protein [candidate division Zixibacteria bacterium]
MAVNYRIRGDSPGVMQVNQLNQFVKDAGKTALDYFGRVTVDYKKDDSVITEADLAVEKFLYEKLTELIPGSKFLGEEGTGNSNHGDSEYLWIVDPIDGTSSYSKGLPIWGISVGLYKNFRPYMASCYFPFVDDHFWLNSDGRAYLNDRELGNLSENEELRSESFTCIPSELFKNCGLQLRMKSRAFGSTCYHILQVARDAAYSTLLCSYAIWDLAGAEAIAETTGARIFDLNGKMLDLSKIVESNNVPEPVVVTYPDRLQKILDRIHYSK